MRFSLTLEAERERSIIPINYQYPLSAAIYKILAKGDKGYAKFLHERGYGKGYKFFTFSDLEIQYNRDGDRMILLEPLVKLIVCFQLPEASRTFVEGLFKSEQIVIADKNSRAVFRVQSIVSLPNPLLDYADVEVIQVLTRPISAVVAGNKNAYGRYDFFDPDDLRFSESLIYSWEQKIAAAWGRDVSESSVLIVEVDKYKNPYRSRLVAIKAGSNSQTRIRGFLNFKLRLTGERRFIDLLLNAGAGLYSAQGMGCLEVVGIEV